VDVDVARHPAHRRRYRVELIEGEVDPGGQRDEAEAVRDDGDPTGQEEAEEGDL
jgi:hypothetical protein